EWNPSITWADKEIRRRRAAIEAAAKKKFLHEEFDEARDLLEKRNCEFWINRCPPFADPDTSFIQWDIEAGHIGRAARRVLDAKTPLLHHVSLVGQAYIDARKYQEGVKFLLEIGDRVGPALRVATLYWFLEAHDQARKVLRAAVAKSFEEASKGIEA